MLSSGHRGVSSAKRLGSLVGQGHYVAHQQSLLALNRVVLHSGVSGYLHHDQQH